MIHWFPGHMAKAKRLILENLGRVDLVVDLRDARAPQASANPLLQEITAAKPRVLVLNKVDLADPEATDLWMKVFTPSPILVSAANRQGLKSLLRHCRRMFRGAPWFSRRPVRAMFVGVPNVGKSRLINALSGQRLAQAGATAGLTRDMRRIPVGRGLEVFDAPGLFRQKIDRPATGLILAALGAVKETLLPSEEVTGEILAFMGRRYPEVLTKRLGLEPVWTSVSELLEGAARRRGCLTANGQVDGPRICQMILKEIREGRFGPITWEWPDGAGWSSVLRPGHNTPASGLIDGHDEDEVVHIAGKNV